MEEPSIGSSSGASKGDIIVALKFAPAPTADGASGRSGRRVRGILMVLIKEAKHLSVPKGSANVDPFCKW